MIERFRKKPFKARLKDTGFLFKHSFKIIGKDEDIKKPTIHMVVLSTIITTLLFLSLLTFFTGTFVFLGVLLLLFTLFILVPFSFFYNVRQKADQSWIVYNTLTGKDISYKDAHRHTSSEKSNLRFIAFVNMLVKYARSQGGNKKGIIGVLASLFLAALAEVWDLLSHYMLPAVVIERKKLKELLPQLKHLKNNVPATLAGVFGIDFAGNVIGGLLFPIYLFLLAISVGIGYLISLTTTATAITFGTFSFSWVPVFITLYIIFIVGGIFRKIVESIKVIYFTIFYASITRPNEITKDVRKEVTNYLLMKEPYFGKTEKELDTSYIKQLEEYISQALKKGYAKNQLREHLISKGYPKEDIDKAFKNLKK